MKKSLIAVLTLSVVLVACKAAPKENQQPTHTIDSVEGYQELQGNVVGNGEKSVLFFYASWCPMCIDKNEKLVELYATEKVPVKTHRVDFDTQTNLKELYGVTMQDTFVLIDGEGKELKKEVAPSFSKLKRLLYLNLDKAEAAEEEGAAHDMEHDMDHDKMAKVPEVPTPPTKVASETSYTSYTEGVIGNGQESVLFFHAAWCPKCQTNDGLLKEYYGSGDFSRSVYKIDFDSSKDLKAKYGVTGQDTFIVIDGSGNEVSRTRFPSPQALKDLLG